MNNFIFCVETEHGLVFGKIKAKDGKEAKELLEFLFKEAGHKTIKHLEMFGQNGDTLQAKGWHGK